VEVERGARWIALPAAVIAVSTSSILIRLTASPPLVTASYRILGASVILLLLAALGGLRDLRALDRRSWSLLVLSGLLLGVHFALWTSSLFLTTVGSAVFLVDTHPVVIAIAAWWFLKEPTQRNTWIGIVLTMLGGALIAAGDFRAGGTALIGDLMAFLAAVAVAGYLVIGRHARRGLSTSSYSGAVFGIAGLLLLTLAFLSESSLIPATRSDPVVWLGLILIPTLGGHTVFNWALRHVPASVVGVSILGEPVISTVLAWPILGEAPAPTAVLGGVLILAGLFVALRATPRLSD
jgi:drug/metabolite transporter (DMT)-like permease